MMTFYIASMSLIFLHWSPSLLYLFFIWAGLIKCNRWASCVVRRMFWGVHGLVEDHGWSLRHECSSRFIDEDHQGGRKVSRQEKTGWVDPWSNKVLDEDHQWGRKVRKHLDRVDSRQDEKTLGVWNRLAHRYSPKSVQCLLRIRFGF